MADILQPTLRPLLGSVLRGVFDSGLLPSLSAFSSLRQGILAGASDVSILAIGDSTGNATDEWVYLWGQWLAAQYPTHTVSYRLWNDGANTYDAAVVLGTGSGPRTIRIWNAHVPGTRTMWLMGSKYVAAITGLSPNLIIWNHGHNHVIGATPQMIQGEIEGSVDQVSLTYPDVPVAAFIQNPNRDDNNMEIANTIWRAIGAQRADITLLDAYSPFIEAGKPASWYTDNVHPSAIGTQVFLSKVTQPMLASAVGTTTVLPPWFSTKIPSLLDGDSAEKYGDFNIANGGSVPAGWTGSGTIVVSDETGNPYPGNARCLKIMGSGVAQTKISRIITANKLNTAKGQKVFLAALVFVQDGSAATVGRIGVFINGTGGGSYNYRAVVDGQGGWKLIGIGPMFVPSDATQVRVDLYQDTSATPDATHYVFYQRAILSIGDVPRDMTL